MRLGLHSETGKATDFHRYRLGTREVRPEGGRSDRKTIAL